MEREIIVEKENLMFNSLSMGEVIDGEVASATITGTAPNQVLNLVLPKGKDGRDGTLTLGDLTEEERESLRGPKGIQGDAGPQGPQGIKGDKGEQGIQGPIGPQGERGPQGIQGEKGVDGTMNFEELTPEQKASLKGDKGEPGIPGTNGATFKPSLDSNGNLSWTNDKGLVNPATVNLKVGVPTKVSQLQNDSGFLTSVPSNYPTTEQMNNAINTSINNVLGADY